MPSNTSAEVASLPARFDNYGALVEGIVLRGIEHPACELKRAVTLSKDQLADRLDFVKLVQGLANSHAGTECLIVIGADQRQKRFFDVDNADEFDPAKLAPILAKYLAPEPVLEVFNDMRAKTGERYVLLAFHKDQPRPIVAVTDGQSTVRTHFRSGDIWIKHNTGLRSAVRSDLDLMYGPFVEKEATKRARMVFDQLKAELGPQLLSQAQEATPVPELLLGSRERLARFVEAMLSGGQENRFKMLVEMARVILVADVRSILQEHGELSYLSEDGRTRLEQHFTDHFQPTLVSLVDMALTVIRYEGPATMTSSVIDLLDEAFAAAREIVVAGQQSITGNNVVPFSRPAYEVFLAARVIATYAVMRKRFLYLRALLPRYVQPVTSRHAQDALQPLLFWPFAGQLGLPEMKNGRNEEYWQQRIGETWKEVFGSKRDFLSAAAQLEFVLELNSHLLVVFQHPVSKQFRKASPDKQTAYLPDFWTSRLEPAVPMAKFILESLRQDGFPEDLAVEPALLKSIFATMPVQGRIAFLGQFLFDLKNWQDGAMMQQRRSPFAFSWPSPLQEAVSAYEIEYLKERMKPNQS